MDLALGQGVARDEREAGRRAAREHPGEGAKETGREPLRGQIVLIIAGVTGERNGGQKLLQGLHLFAVDGPLGILRLLEPEVSLQPAAHCVVQRQPDDFVARGMSGDTAIEGICG